MNTKSRKYRSLVLTVLTLTCALPASAIYNPTSGRWLNRDPISDESTSEHSDEIRLLANSINSDDDIDRSPYRFSDNAPIYKIDVLGLWPSLNHWLFYPPPSPQTHERCLGRTLPSSLPDPAHALLILTASTLEVDSDQSVSGSYKHAMKSRYQSAATAKAKANDYVRQHILRAEELLCCKPDLDEALHQFGLALHTIQDATSPAHTGFQTWYSPWTDPFGAKSHIKKEGFDPGAGSALDGATTWLWTFFVCRNVAPELPRDFFANLGFDASPQ